MASGPPRPPSLLRNPLSLAGLFVAARGACVNAVADPRAVNLLNVGCISADGRSLAELVDTVEQARAQGGWAVLMIHGIGADTHELHLDPEVHRQFIAWLARQRSTLWTAPFREVAAYIKKRRRADDARAG